MLGRCLFSRCTYARLLCISMSDTPAWACDATTNASDTRWAACSGRWMRALFSRSKPA